MPQFNDYPLVSELLAADLILIYKDSVGALRTIDAQDLADSIKSLMNDNLSIEVVSSSTTLDGDNEFIVANSGSVFTLTLPDSTDFPGKPFYIANKGSATVTIAAAAGDTIGGQPSIALAQYKTAILISDGLAMYHWFGNPS